MMKIVIINNGLSGGGIERASSSLANYLSSKGYKIYVIALYKREQFFSISSEITFIEPSFVRSKSRLEFVYNQIKYIRSHIKMIAPDCILAYGEWTNSFVVISTLRLKIPLYLSDRMSPTLDLGLVQNCLKRICYRLADGLIAQTSFASEVLYMRTGNKNITIIPNPVNVIEPIDIAKKKQIVSVGRLSKEKGHIVLIEAFSKLCNNDWSLLIVGDGPEMDNLKQRVIELRIDARVFFAGYKNDFTKELSESEIFVLPSLSEGFPNALIEAMSLPLACISSDCVAGPGDIIKHGHNGLLVKPGCVNELVSCIDELINDNEKRLKLASNAYQIRSSLSFDRIAEQYLKFIHCKI